MDEKHNKIEHRFINEALVKLYPDFDKRKMLFSGSGSGPGTFSFHLDPAQLVSCTSQYDYEPKTFEHFTSLRGLYNILNSGLLRMYSLHNMNDPTEYYHAVPEEFKSKIESQKEKVYVLSGTNSSFLSNVEIFNMWRKYAENGFGAKINFEVDIPQGFYNKNILFNKVIYNKLDIHEFLATVEQIENEEGIKIDFLDSLVGASILHKHPLYETENEIRIAVFDQYGAEGSIGAIEFNNNLRREYSYTSNRLTNYRMFKINEENEEINFKILDVELGFKHLNNDINHVLLQRILNKKYNNAIVKLSEIENVIN